MTQVLESPANGVKTDSGAGSGSGGGQGGSGTGNGSGSGVNEPWAKSWIKPDFTLDHKALDRLPDHLKDLRPTLERQKDFEGVLGVLSHSMTVAGKKALAPLAPDAPEGVRNERKALLDTINGVPKEPKEYGIAKPQDLPDAAWNGALAESFAAWAHKHSVPPGAAKELIQLVIDDPKGGTKAQLAAQKQYEDQFFAAEQKAFETTVRAEGIQADRANALVEKGAIALGLDLNNEQTKTLLKGSAARLMALRHAIAIGEDKVVTGAGSGGADTRDYLAQAQDIQRNPANPEYAVYHNREGKYSRSQQDAVIQRVNELLALDADKRSKGTGQKR